MSGSNSKATYHPDGFVILSDESSETPPLSCPVCGYFMKTSTDTEYWQKHKCCEECGIKWAEGFYRDEWKQGWRPDPEEIRREVERRSTLVPRLNLLLGDN